jgi:hypothetical protein
MTQKELAPDGAFCIEQTTQEYLENQLDYYIEGKKQDSVNKQEAMRQIRQVAADAGFTVRETNALSCAIVSDSKARYVMSDEYNPEFKWTIGMSVAGLNHMMETSCSAEEALQYVKTIHEKDDFWLKSTRNKPLTRKVITESVREVEATNEEKIRHLKKVSHYKKKSLLKATTPSRQMNQLEEVITIADRVDKLESITQKQGDEIISLKSEIHELQLRMQISEQNIRTIGDTVNVKTIDLKEQAMKLKDTYTIEQIAQILGLKERKVKYLVYGK